MKLILASQSPRRAELLTQIGVSFTRITADIDETPLQGESPDDYVARMAKEKAQAVAQRLGTSVDNNVILAADTIVVSGTNILGKPKDFEDFSLMMKSLSQTEHSVKTAICVLCQEHLEVRVVSTNVTFTQLSETDIQWYWSTQEPQDKAGGYGIQGLGGQFVTHINGSYSAVVGLPLYETKQLLTQVGFVTRER
jgi:septum formation protein